MAPFPSIERWRIPKAACEQTRESVLPAGRRGNESGVFWLGGREAVSTVTAVVKPVSAGVVELPWQWSVSPEAYAAVTAWAKPRKLTLLAAVHTHLSPHPPRMSRTDRTQGLKVPDALAVIVGSGGEEEKPSQWGWFVYESGDYRTIIEPEWTERVELTGDVIEYVEIGDNGAAWAQQS